LRNVIGSADLAVAASAPLHCDGGSPRPAQARPAVLSRRSGHRPQKLSASRSFDPDSIVGYKIGVTAGRCGRALASQQVFATSFSGVSKI
jgi:hypothetical protein